MKVFVIVISIFFFSVVFLVFFVRYRIQNITDKKNLRHSLESRIKKYLKSNEIDAIVIGVYKNGKSCILNYGYITPKSNLKPDSCTLFELASTSKLFTTSVLQILCDNGVVSMNDKIADILKEKVLLPSIAQNTTLKDLATHRSGFPSVPNFFLNKMDDESNPYKNLKLEDMYQYLKTCEDKKEDGNYEYSNFGMGLLGHLLELKTNSKFEELIKKELLLKLGMNQTSISINDSLDHLVIQGYNALGVPAPIWIDNVFTGAGSFLSNGRDMIKFIQANLSCEKNEIVSSLIKTHSVNSESEFGIGWIHPSFIDKYLGNGNIIWHNGMAGGYSSFLSIDKSTNSGLVILTNKAVDISPLGLILTRLVSSQSWNN